MAIEDETASPRDAKSPAQGRGFYSGEACYYQARELSDNPIVNAFCRVAPSDLFKRRAIDRAGIFLRASDLRSRSCTDVQVRLFEAFFGMPISSFLRTRTYKAI